MSTMSHGATPQEGVRIMGIQAIVIIGRLEAVKESTLGSRESSIVANLTIILIQSKVPIR